MKKQLFIKIFSALLNLIAFTLPSVLILSLHKWYQSGDALFFFFWTLPPAIGLALCGRAILNLIRTTDRALRMALIFTAALLISLGWGSFMFFLWGTGHKFNILEVAELPVVYYWIAGNFIQLLFLDRKLPESTEKTSPAKIFVGILAFPLTLIALWFMMLYADSIFSSLKYKTDSAVPVLKESDYWLKTVDSTDASGYADLHGNSVVPCGKYHMCFTDTFRTYAVVVKDSTMVAIDREEHVLYQVYAYDNGPDYASDDLFRIVLDNKMGYADLATGKIIIAPQFQCAFPFEEGVARVSNDCKTINDGHKHPPYWDSDHWFYIDKNGNKVTPPKTEE